eukprot:m.15758 g.15758  ORF g.15758 m.15758 type:complete len:62 (-) comp4957_c0_seq2:439-624(-)
MLLCAVSNASPAPSRLDRTSTMALQQGQIGTTTDHGNLAVTTPTLFAALSLCPSRLQGACR